MTKMAAARDDSWPTHRLRLQVLRQLHAVLAQREVGGAVLAAQPHLRGQREGESGRRREGESDPKLASQGDKDLERHGGQELEKHAAKWPGLLDASITSTQCCRAGVKGQV